MKKAKRLDRIVELLNDVGLRFNGLRYDDGKVTIDCDDKKLIERLEAIDANLYTLDCIANYLPYKEFEELEEKASAKMEQECLAESEEFMRMKQLGDNYPGIAK